MLQFKNWSNAIYLVPLIVASYWHLWLTAVLSLCVALFGFLYHLSQEKRHVVPDMIFAWSLIVSNVVLCYWGSFKEPYFAIAVLFLCLALFYRYFPWTKQEYDVSHGLWHVYGALITLFCIFTYTA